MVGFPHSEIPGSKLIRSSPRLIAAYYVLHRLHAPRHPLDALKTLDRSHYRCPLPNQPLLKRSVHLRTRTNDPHLLEMWIGFDRSDQKRTRIHVHLLSLSLGRDQTSSNASLYDVERSGHRHPKVSRQPNLLSDLRRIDYRYFLVEPDGIEPTTFCLQSRRSPN